MQAYGEGDSAMHKTHFKKSNDDDDDDKNKRTTLSDWLLVNVMVVSPSLFLFVGESSCI